MDIQNILKVATLEIYEFDIEVRHEMSGINRVLPYYVMSYLKEGQAILRVGDKTIETNPKDTIIVPINTKHDHIKIGAKPAIFLWWHFNFRIYDSIDVLKLINLPIKFTMEDNAQFEQVFSDYVNFSRKPPTLKSIVYQRAKILEIMAHLLGAALDSEHVNKIGKIPKVFSDILEYLLSETVIKISLEELAERFNMHPTYLSNRFKLYFGTSPITLFREKQFNQAKSMLLLNNASVSEIADALGFENTSNFTRFFTKKSGMSPSDFKKSDTLGLSTNKNIHQF